jgi:hypothetical protein
MEGRGIRENKRRIAGQRKLGENEGREGRSIRRKIKNKIKRKLK